MDEQAYQAALQAELARIEAASRPGCMERLVNGLALFQLAMYSIVAVIFAGVAVACAWSLIFK